MAIYTMMFLGMAPLGGLMGGLLAHRLGAPLTVALGGAACLACGGAFTLHYRRWREGARELVRAAEREAAARG
jgi:hypothetical protein